MGVQSHDLLGQVGFRKKRDKALEGMQMQGETRRIRLGDVFIEPGQFLGQAEVKLRHQCAEPGGIASELLHLLQIEL